MENANVGILHRNGNPTSGGTVATLAARRDKQRLGRFLRDQAKKHLSMADHFKDKLGGTRRSCYHRGKGAAYRTFQLFNRTDSIASVRDRLVYMMNTCASRAAECKEVKPLESSFMRGRASAARELLRRPELKAGA